MSQVLAVADDLSGAAESAAELAGAAVDGDAALRRTLVLLAADRLEAGWAGEDVVVLDTDSRVLPPEHLADAVRAAYRTLASAPSGIRFKKIDSQLRGNTGPELQLWSRHTPLAVAPALPSLGRIVVDGALRLPATPGEPERTIRVGDLLPGRRVRVVPLEVVELGVGPVTAALDHATASGTTVVLDATTDAHLDVLAAALLAVPALLPAGSGGLAAAFGRVIVRGRIEHGRVAPPHRTERCIAVVVGSIDPAVAPQLDELRRRGIPIHVVGGNDVDPAVWRRNLRTGCAAFAVAPDRPLAVDPVASATALVDRLHPVLRDADVDLVLTGGETARRMLDRLGETVLRPRRRVHAGAVVSLTGSGRLVATRPGSFGGADSLAAMIASLRAERRPPITTPPGLDDHE
jgi:uncharacterized protein YgbK (DUF1537 family)